MNIITLCFIIFLDSLGSFVTFPLLLKFIYKLHLVHTYTNQNILFGLLLGITPLFGIILVPAVSYLSDIIGRKKVLCFSLILSTLTNLVMVGGFALQSILILFVAKALNGIAATSQPIAEAAVIDNTQGISRSYKIGLITFCMVLAMTIGPVLGAYLSDSTIYHRFNLYTPLYITIAASLLNILLLMTTYREAKKTLPRATYRWLDTIKFSLRHPQLLACFGMFFLMQFSWALFYQSLPLTLMKVFNLSINHISFLLSAISLVMAFGLLIINYYLLKLFTPTKIILSTFFMAAVCYFWLSFPITLIELWVLSTLLAVVVGLYYPSLVATMSYYNRTGKQGWLMGCNTSLMSIAWLVSGVLVGYLANMSVHAHFVVEAVCAVLALGLGVIGTTRTRERRTTAHKILIYNDEGCGQRSVYELLATLTKMVDLSCIQLQIVDATYVNTSAWQAETRLFVMPGGRARPYYQALGATWQAQDVMQGQMRKLDEIGLGNRRIKEFVAKQGGSYLGICAGAYYGADQTIFERHSELEVLDEGALKFFKGIAEGSVYVPGKFAYHSEIGATVAHIDSDHLPRGSDLAVYFNGGCFFHQGEKEMSAKNILAYYTDISSAANSKKMAAIIECQVGLGSAILSGVHLEHSSFSKGINADIKAELLKQDEERLLFFARLIERLGVPIDPTLKQRMS